MKYKISVDGTEHEVTLLNRENDLIRFQIKGTVHEVKISPALNHTDLAGSTITGNLSNSSDSKEVKAPMPGFIIKLNCKPNDLIKKGDALAVIEAMKMENNITSTRDGIIESILVNEGQEVKQGAILIHFK